MGLAFVPLYIKYLGIEAYGLIGLYALLQAWLGLLDIGLTPTLGREMARFTGGAYPVQSILNLLRSIEVIAICTGILIAGGVTLSAEWVASNWVRAENLSVKVVAEAFTIMGIVTAIRFYEGVYKSCIVGLQRQVLLNIVTSFIATLRWLGCVAVLIWISPTIKAFFLWQAAVSLVSIVILCSITYRSLPLSNEKGRFSFDVIREVWGFAGGVFIITLLALLLTQVDKILLSKLLTLSNYGYYTLAAVVAGALYLLISPVTQAFYPKFCELRERNEAALLVENYHKGAQLVSVIAGSAAIVLIVFAETFLRLWTKDESLAELVAPLLSLLMTGNLLNGLMWIPYQIQLAHGLTGLAVRINLVAVTAIVPAIVWVTPRYGAEGAAWVWVGLNVGYLVFGVHFMFRRVLKKEKCRWYIWDVLVPLGAGVCSISVFSALWAHPVGAIADVSTLVFAFCITFSTSLIIARETRLQLCSWFKSCVGSEGAW